MNDVVDAVVRRTIELAEVPAPTGEESARAEVVRGWWTTDGFGDVRTDATGNVWALARRGAGPAVVLCAHLDTVFGRDVVHEVRAEDDRLVGPSVGDDSVGVAALAATAQGLADAGPPVWLLATVGEEGLGNLRGVTGALQAPPAPVGALIAVEGNYLGRVSRVGVGSVRRRVHLSGPGGHAWEAADAPSAVHAAATLVAEIAALPRIAGTALNVGRIAGGEGINMRAREAWFEIDLRADDPVALATLATDVLDRIRAVPAPIAVEVEAIGDRPAGSLRGDHALVRAAREALQEHGTEPTEPATSTDANAAHPLDVPAIAVGVTRGSGEHTADEWIEVGAIAVGISALTRTIERYGELTG